MSMTGSSGSSKSSSIIGQSFPLLTRFHFEQQGSLGALPARDADKREPPIDNSGWYRPYRVPVGEALRLYAELSGSGKQARFLYFPDENHWILKPGDIRVWYESVFAFLAENLLGAEWRRPQLL